MEADEGVLDQLVTKFDSAAFEVATRKAYKCQVASYMGFCKRFRYIAVPASTLTIKRYIAYLSLTHAYSSIKVYVNIIRLLHMQAGYDNPMCDFGIKQVMKGLRRCLGDHSSQRAVMTTEIMQVIRSGLDMDNYLDVVVWAVCLIAFYGMLRLSSLFPPNPHKLLVSNVKIFKWGIAIKFTYSKTVQFSERDVYVSIPWNSDGKMCAASALLRSWKLSHVHSSQGMLSYRKRGQLASLSRKEFVTRVDNVLLSCGYVGFTGHSFRRGGATHALHCGVPTEIIMAQGDWKSTAYLSYLDSSDVHKRALHVSKMY